MDSSVGVDVIATAADHVSKPRTITEESPLPIPSDVSSRIIRQMEKYLSDENLLRDQLLQKHLLLDETNEGYIPLDLFASFAKVKKITTDQDILRDALKKSEFLVLNDFGTHVKRKTPLVLPAKAAKAAAASTLTVKPRSNPAGSSSISSNFPISNIEAGTANSLHTSQGDNDDSNVLSTSPNSIPPTPTKNSHIIESNTIYACHIPKNSDKVSLHNIFGICGNITRIDIPVDKKSGNGKGIAFIEFVTEEQAKAAIAQFNEETNLFYQIGVRVKPYKAGLKLNKPNEGDINAFESQTTAPMTIPYSPIATKDTPADGLSSLTTHLSPPSSPNLEVLLAAFSRAQSNPELESPSKYSFGGHSTESMRPPLQPTALFQDQRRSSKTNLNASAPQPRSLSVQIPTAPMKTQPSPLKKSPASTPTAKDIRMEQDWRSSFADDGRQPPDFSSLRRKSITTIPLPQNPSSNHNPNNEIRRKSITTLPDSAMHLSRSQPSERPTLRFARRESIDSIIPIRQPKGPDGTKGFATRERLVPL